jgi:hypothetical protein
VEQLSESPGIGIDRVQSLVEKGKAGVVWLRAQWISLGELVQREYADKLREANRVWEETRTPVERFHTQIEKLAGLFRDGFISQDTFDRAVENAKKALAGFDLGEVAGIEINRGVLTGGQRAEQIFTQESQQDKQLKVTEKQLEEQKKTNKILSNLGLAFN